MLRFLAATERVKECLAFGITSEFRLVLTRSAA